MSPLHMLWIVPVVTLGGSFLLWLLTAWVNKEMARIAAEVNAMTTPDQQPAVEGE